MSTALMLRMAAEPASAASDGVCLCRQVALWVLICLGYALPLVCQYMGHTAALQAFLRR